MNGRLAYASLFSVAALVAVSSALLSAVSCTTNEIPTNDGSGDDDDASSDADLAFDGDPNTSLVTTISPYTCADAQSYVCTNASGDLAAATCNNGTFACPTGYTVLPVMTFSGADANATVGGCGGTASNGKALGICHDYTTCAEYGLIDVDKGAVQACEDDSICCTTVCPAGLCELLDGGGSFSPSCAAATKTLICPVNARLVAADAGSAAVVDAAADAMSDAGADASD
jgi:hypothetical protein